MRSAKSRCCSLLRFPLGTLISFLLALRRLPVGLLCLPLCPLERLFRAGWAAVAAQGMARTKALLAALEQTTAGPRSGHERPWPTRRLLRAIAGKMVVRAHGR
jgi:hypothetical protein